MAQVNKTGSKATTKPSNNQKAAKTPETVVQQTFRSVSQAHRCLHRWIDRWTRMGAEATEAKDIAKFLVDVTAEVATIKGSLETLHSAGWVAPKSAGGGGANKAPELVEGAHVWIRPKYREEYLAVFSTMDLANLAIDKIIGEKGHQKILVRIGPRAEGGKMARVIGFTPKGHLTTRPNEEAAQKEAAAK